LNDLVSSVELGDPRPETRARRDARLFQIPSLNLSLLFIPFKIVMKSFKPILYVLWCCLINLNHVSNAEEEQSIIVTFRNELPEPVVLYWEGENEREVQNNGEPIAALGGEIVTKTYPGHLFSYDYGGERHPVRIFDSSDSLRVLTAGRTEIAVKCTVTSQGNTVQNEGLTIRVIPWWSPRGACRFLELVRLGYYNHNALTRVRPKFLTQFGISADYEMRTHWRSANIADDPVHDPRIPFLPGSLSFAGSGPDSRSTEIFIVMPETPQSQLDYFGINPWETPFGFIDDVSTTPVATWYSYGDMPPWGEGVDPQKVYKADGYEYLKRDFPRLDYIETCEVEEIVLDETASEL
jgi:peptidyl-prolyl cis-trans isomerase A (cyclophilin A)